MHSVVGKTQKDSGRPLRVAAVSAVTLGLDADGRITRLHAPLAFCRRHRGPRWAHPTLRERNEPTFPFFGARWPKKARDIPGSARHPHEIARRLENDSEGKQRKHGPTKKRSRGTPNVET